MKAHEELQRLTAILYTATEERANAEEALGWARSRLEQAQHSFDSTDSKVRRAAAALREFMDNQFPQLITAPGPSTADPRAITIRNEHPA